MRPLRLELTAFGPFADTQVVDFRELGDRRIFLVHGATGAGKSTLLDAMGFALFGRLPDDRAPTELRSHHATRGPDTGVVFDFALGDEVYRVERTPAQVRPKRRGDGETKVPPKATLFVRTGCEDDAEEGRPLVSGEKKVSDEVERRLGLAYEQFRQVIVLPQGEFRKLLLAGSDERESIFKRLFDVSIYQHLQDALIAASSGARQDLEALTRDRDALLEQAGAEDEAAVDAQLVVSAASIQVAEEHVVEATRARDAARGALETGRGLVERFEAWRKARAESAALEARAAEFANLADRVETAQAVAPAVQAAETARARREELAARRRAVAAGREALEQAEGEEAELRSALETVEARARTEGDTLRSEKRDLENLAAVAQTLDQARAALERATQERDGAAARVDAEVEIVQREEATLEALEATIEREAARADAAPQARADAEAARSLADRSGEALERCETLGRLRSEQVQWRGEAQAAEKALDAARAEVEVLRLSQRSGRASLLAASLRAGEPCPVCGSPDHPAPARSVDGVVATDAQVDAAEARLAEITERHRMVKAGEDRVDRQIEEETGLLRSLARAIGLRLEEVEAEGAEPLPDPDRFATALSDAVAGRAAAEARCVEAEAAVGARAEAQEARTRARTRLEAARGRLEAARAAGARAAERFAESKGRVEADEARLPEALRAPGALIERTEAVTRRLEALERELAQASRAADAARQKLAGAAADARSQAKEMSDAVVHAEKAEALLRRQLAEVGLDSEAALEERHLSKEALREASEKLVAYRADRQAAASAEAKLAAELEGRAEPALDALESAARTAEEALASATDARAQARERHAQRVDLRERLRERAAALTAAHTRFGVIGGLADVARGQGANQKNLSFQNFILAAFLEEVLELAAATLETMTRGRYRLLRNPAPADGRRKAGLDLLVSDAHTGLERPVKTLSGGESFLAALALALGLAEVVQERSGGVRIDTLFIDEGFGSLDPEALELALRALVDLQDGGRLVGVISHVPELRERIDARLTVRSGRRGSEVHFELG